MGWVTWEIDWAVGRMLETYSAREMKDPIGPSVQALERICGFGTAADGRDKTWRGLAGSVLHIEQNVCTSGFNPSWIDCTLSRTDPFADDPLLLAARSPT